MEIFRQLKVWQKAHQLVLVIYRITRQFPSEEKYGLISQMRRAAVSIPANIAEGTKRKTIKDRQYFHVIADASLEELKYYLILSAELKFISWSDSDKVMEQCREVGKMLNGLSKAMTQNNI